MNIIDLAVVALLAVYVLFGFYRGFINSVMNLGAMLLSWLISTFAYPLLSTGLQQLGFYDFVRFYIEGAERIADHELAVLPVANLAPGQIDEIISGAGLPMPFGDAIAKNVDSLAFAGTSFTTVGDYFEATLACVVVNILAFFMLYILLRIIFTVLTNAYAFSVRLPHLASYDRLLGGGVGFMRGAFAMFILFTLLPCALIALPVKIIVDIVNDSFFTGLFYNASPLIHIFSSVINR